MTDAPRTRPFAATMDILVVAVTLLAPTLGGATELWQKAALFLAAAAVMLIAPPRTALPRSLLPVLAGLLAMAAIPLLPTGVVLPGWDWPQRLATEFQIPRSTTFSPQPWVTLEGLGTLAGTLAWGAFLLARRWELTRHWLLTAFVSGALALTGVAIVLHFSGGHFDLWRVETGAFGFFPHRNQTATFLALSGLLSLALAADRYQHRDWMALFWLLAYFVFGAALVLNFSRAGVLLFILGSFMWLLLISHFEKRYYAIGLGLTGMFLLVALFILFGGATWERFRSHIKSGRSAVQGEVFDFRILVQKDALTLVRPASWHGLGIGNFEAAFAQERRLSRSETRAEHPDSDWLWAWLELGPVGTALILAALTLALLPAWPMHVASGRRIRIAALVGTGMYVVHGFVDVSGHVLGTVFPGLFALAVARNWPETQPAKGSLAPLITFRALAAGLLALGMVWLLAVAKPDNFATTARVGHLQAQIARAEAAKDTPRAIAAATSALTIAPLDWQLYLARGKARARINAQDPEAALDLQRALHLEPNSVPLAFDIGRFWLETGQRTQALTVWKEALRRAGHQTDDRFILMLLAAAGNPEMLQGIWDITGENARRKLTFLENIRSEEFDGYLAQWLREEPTLENVGPEGLNHLFSIWYQRGNRRLLEEKLNANERWRKAGARWLVETIADRGDFANAYQSAIRNLPPPKLPPRGDRRALLRLEREFALRPQDFGTGLALFLAYIENEQLDAALDTVSKLTALPKCPPYFHYLQAQQHARREEWREAWTAWRRYAGDPK